MIPNYRTVSIIVIGVVAGLSIWHLPNPEAILRDIVSGLFTLLGVSIGHKIGKQ